MSSKSRVAQLKQQASQGKNEDLLKLLSSYKFSQLDMDNAFRECVKHFSLNKNVKENFKNCLNLFLKKTEDINFKNPNNNNTTILMYALDQSQEIPCDLIIACSQDDLDYNILDNNNENTLFHLVKNKTFNENTKIDFYKQMQIKEINLGHKNISNESIIDILVENNEETLLNKLREEEQNKKSYPLMLNKSYNAGKYEEINDFFSKFISKDYLLIVNKYSLEYNKYLVSLKLVIQSLSKSKVHFLNSLAIDEYNCKIISVLKKVNISDNQYSTTLFLNKLIMFYQLDNFKEFQSLKNQIDEVIFLNKNRLLYFAKGIIYMDMLLERNRITEAKDEIKILKDNIASKEITSREIEIPPELGYNPTSKDKENDDISKIIKLYEVFLGIYNLDKKKGGLKKLVEQLKNIEVEKNSKRVQNFHSFLLYRLNYLENQLYPKSLNIDLSTNAKKDEMKLIYLLQYHGIENLRKGRYNISSIFFLKCLNIINQKTPYTLIKRNHFYPCILFNLSLAYFYQKKYDLTIKLLYLLLNYSNNKAKYFVNNKYIYYRLALAQLELTLQNNQSANNLYKLYNKKLFILKERSPGEHISISGGIIDNLKKTLILIKNNPNDNIYFSTITNLIFCYLLNEDYTHAIFYLKACKTKDSFQETIINSYLLQCYIYLNKLDKAQEISQKLILKDMKKNNDYKFFERLNNKLINISEFQLAMWINFVKLSILNNRNKDLGHYLILILNSVKFNISINDKGKVDSFEELPHFIINVFVYYYLYYGRRDLAIDILKTRKFKQFLLPKEQ